MNKNQQHRIALVLPYFGKWPDWFCASLISCVANPDIDWHLISDCGEPEGLPPNVYYHPSSLGEVAARASEHLGFPVHLQRAYKLCDLKPAYGLMFRELLKNYDFWGHCDPDILWGSIRKFMTPRLLENYDILTSRKDALAGHFCIYRNEDRINQLCLETTNWEQMLNDNSTSYMLDEAYFSRLIDDKAAADQIRVYQKRTLTTSGSDQKPVLLAGERIAWKGIRPVDANGKKISYRHWFFRGRPMIWKAGRTWNAYGQEVMYLHFHQLKSGFGPCTIRCGDHPNTMIISKTGICGGVE